MEANSQLINYNLMASLRTGNVIVDMAIAMFVPQLMALLVNLFNYMIPLFRSRLDKLMTRRYRRQIVYSYEARPYNDVETASRNGILQQAIRQYIGRQMKTPYHEGLMKLSKIESTASASKSGTIVEQLEKSFKIICLPQKELFEEIESGLFFMESYTRSEEDPDEDGNNNRKKAKKSVSKTVVTMVFEASHSGGEAKVNEFIQRAYDWYLTEVEKDEDKSRFMYQPLVRDRFASADDRRKARVYKRYELSSEKTFRSLFFPEKDRLMKILENFDKKTGKYAIQGFPHKLGLLLHGPPGTGKTSLVKAIAAHTGRSIISVPLSRIHTNQELMDVMFDQQFNYKAPKKNAEEDGDDDAGSANKLAFKDVIFLLEDVDAASDVVHARSTKQSTMAKQVTHAIERQCTHDFGSKPSTPQAASKGANDLIAEQKMLLEIIQMQNKSSEKKDDVDGADGEKKDKKSSNDWFLSDKDKLNLSGLLTVLDGVIDAPGRILIMTTNHPEKLDPALTRPGRVNMQIYMGFIKLEQAKDMVRHYYQSAATDASLKCIEEAFVENHRLLPGGFKMSPAEMEQLCAECDTIEQLGGRIVSKGRDVLEKTLLGH